jgi:4-amino-4-deoxy-L-arabinose transferase-like glycosyltransferase
LIIAVTLINLTWIRLDTRIQPFLDPYPRKALELFDGLREHGFKELPRLMKLARVGPRPPIYQLLATPFIFLVERSIDGMLRLNLWFQAILILSTYLIGKLVKDAGTGLLATLLVATYPPLVNLTKIVRPHSITPACVALSVWLLLLLIKTRSVKIAWLFSASLLLAFLIHPNLFYYLPLPTFLFSVYLVFFWAKPWWPSSLPEIPPWLLSKLRDPFLLKGLFPAALTTTALIAAWYVPLSQEVKNLIQHSATTWSDVRYGFQEVPASFWWYTQTMPGAISYPLTALLAGSLIVYLFRWRSYRSVLAIIFLLMYTGMGLRKGTLAWMNFAAILPVAAVLSAAFVLDLFEYARQLRETAVGTLMRPLAVVLLIVSVIVPLFNLYVVTWHPSPDVEAVAHMLGAPLKTSCRWRMIVAFCPNPPREQDWRMVEILQAVIADPKCQQDECILAVVTEDVENFSFAALDYYRTQAFPQANLVIVPIRFPNIPNINWLTADFLLYIPQLRNNDYANAVSSFIAAPPVAFSHSYRLVATFTLPQHWQARLVRRIQPLTITEAENSIAWLRISPQMKADLLAQTTPMKE